MIYYSLDESPLQIDHIGYCKGPNALLRIGQNIIVIGRIRSRPHNILNRFQNILKVVITTQKEKSALPVKRHLHMCQCCINKEASASVRHTLTCSWRDKFWSCSWRRERERHTHSFERTFCICLSYILALYWLSIIRKFWWVFSPMSVSQDKWCVSCDCVFLSDPILCYCYLLKWKEI